MPYKEKEITKKYFTIGEVALKLNVNTSLIRFWETEFDYINPKKNKKGSRKYTSNDIKKLEKVYSLLKEEKFTIDGAKKILKKKDPQKKEIVISKLENIRKKLIELKTKI